MSRARVDPSLVRTIAVRLAFVLVAQGLAIAAYYSVIAMYLKLPFGSGEHPFAVARWWHLAVGDALFVGAALARRALGAERGATLGAAMPFAAVAFGAWAGTDPPVGRVLVSVLLLAPALAFSAWALPAPRASGEGAS
jgi:hypothetical protein